MSPLKCPTAKVLFAIWLAAIRGDDQAKRDLFAIQTRYPETGKQLAQFAKQRDRDKQQRKKQLGIKESKPLSEWQKASNTVTKRGVHIVNGGLPSLGKKR